MRKLLKSGVALALLGGLAVPAFAQSTNQATTTATTEIIRPVTIEEEDPLAFGRIVRPTTGTSTITLAAADTDDTPNESGAGDALLLGGTTSRAEYTVSGEGGQQVTVTLSTLSLSNGTTTIPVTLDRSPTGTLTLSGNLGDTADGTATLFVGGSFNIDNTVSTGAYTGTFTVEVAYQ